MEEALGRIDLRNAQLEQTSMGFMIHDRIGNKVCVSNCLSVLYVTNVFLENSST